MSVPRTRILLVEDDDSLRRLVSRHLGRHGFEVIEAASAEDAARVLAAGIDPAVVLLDINLPGDTGWDLLRSTAPRGRRRPAVVVTSATRVSPARLAEFGVAGYLPKPFPLETLVATVERLSTPKGSTSNP